jgi:hypothetical protein
MSDNTELSHEDFMGVGSTDPDFDPIPEMPHDEFMGQTLPPKDKKKYPLVGWDGVATDYFEQEEPYDSDALLKYVYGGNYDDTSLFGGTDLSDNWNMQLLGYYETNDGRKEKFKDWYPDGELRYLEADGREFALARKSKEAPWQRISGWQSTPVSAVVNLPVAGSIAAGVATAGMGLWPAIGAQILGTGAGVLSQEAIMSQFEANRTNPWLKATGESGVAALMEFVMRGGAVGTILRDMVRRAPTPGAEKAFRATRPVEEGGLGLAPMTGGQFTSNPEAVAIYSQRTGLNQDALEKAIKPFESLNVDGLQKYIDNYGFSGVNQRVLEHLYAKQLDDAASILRGVKSGKRGLQEGSEELVEAWGKFDIYRTAMENRLYTDARAGGVNAEFDIMDAVSEAKKIRQGTQARPATGNTPVAVNPAKGELRSVVDTLSGMHGMIGPYTPPGSGTIESGLQQIMDLRTRVGNLIDNPDRSVSGPAKRLYGLLTESIQNPQNADPDFVTKWNKANSFYAANRDVDKLKIVHKLNTASPHEYARLGRSLLQADNAEQLKFAHDVIKQADPKAWDEMRGSFIDYIAHNPTKGKAILDGWENAERLDVRDLIVDADELDVLNSYIKETKRVENSPVAKHQADTDIINAEKAITLADGDIGDLSAAVDAHGGKNSNFARSIKAGLAYKWQQAARIENEFGEDIIDPTIMLKEIKETRRSGKFKVLFTPEDWKWLEHIDNYAVKLGKPPLRSLGGDPAGASLAVHEQAQRKATALWKAVTDGLVPAAEAAYRVPLSMSIAARFMGLDKPVTRLPTDKSIAGHALNLMANAVKNTPLIWLEMQDNVQHTDIFPIGP